MCDTVIDILKDNTNYLDKLQNEINDLTERVVKLDSGLKYDPDITNDYDDEDDVRYGLETLLKQFNILTNDKYKNVKIPNDFDASIFITASLRTFDDLDSDRKCLSVQTILHDPQSTWTISVDIKNTWAHEKVGLSLPPCHKLSIVYYTNRKNKNEYVYKKGNVFVHNECVVSKDCVLSTKNSPIEYETFTDLLYVLETVISQVKNKYI
jgi:hypothetical protein